MAGLDIGDVAKEASTPATKRRKIEPIQKPKPWTDRHSKKTFYIHNNIIEAITREAKETGRSKSNIFNTALADYFDVDIDT